MYVRRDNQSMRGVSTDHRRIRNMSSRLHRSMLPPSTLRRNLSAHARVGNSRRCTARTHCLISMSQQSNRCT